jgi:hypothetical protein
MYIYIRMISKVKTKKTCIKLLKEQKGGTSSAPKQKIPKKLKKTIKQINKMIKVASSASLNPNFASEFKSGKKITLNELNYIKVQQPKIYHLLPKTHSEISKAANRFKKYTRYNNKRIQTYNILAQYVKNLENKTSKSFNTSKDLHKAILSSVSKNIKSFEDQTLLINEIKKMLHPIT